MSIAQLLSRLNADAPTEPANREVFSTQRFDNHRVDVKHPGARRKTHAAVMNHCPFGGKVIYSSKLSADQAAFHCGLMFSSYLCPNCGYYHLTSRK